MKLRLAQMQKAYMAEFHAMNTLVDQLRATSDYLPQPLAVLN